MSNLFEHCRTEISSASQRYEKPEAMQINLLFAEAKYSRCSQSAISLCQSAAGGGCAGGRRRSDAALCMSGCGLPLFGCGRRANLSKLYFSRPPACGIALQKQPILISSTSRTSDWVSPARSGFTTFCHQKVAPKVSAGHLRRDRTEVLTERAQKTALLRRKRLHRFDCGGSAKSASGLCTRLLPVVLHARSGRSNLRPICFLLRCNAESMVRSARHDLFRCNSSILNLAGLGLRDRTAKRADEVTTPARNRNDV